MRLLSPKGLPLKIQTQWTNDDYWNRKYEDSDELECVNVSGWLVRINGKKFPRGHTDGDGTPDWTYRYTSEHSEQGKQIAIDRALQEGGFL